MRAVPAPLRVPRSALAIFALLLLALRGQAEDGQRIDLGGGAALELVRIEPGHFQQGSPSAERNRGAEETPHAVEITQPFYLGKFPVTRGEFARFVSETRYRTEAETGPSGGFGWDGEKLVQRKEFTWKNPGFPQTDEHPVTLVTFNDANAFLAWLSRKSGRRFSLPSEAQWEYACRAGSTTAFVNGDDSARVGDIAWFRENSGQGTQPVGGKGLNPWGLGDMPGNVWEWCSDWFAPYAGAALTDPIQTNANLSDKPRRVLRGGSWLRDAAMLRSAARYRNDAASRNADNGFRVMTFDAAPPPRPAVTPAQSIPGAINLERDGARAAAPAEMHTSSFEHEPAPRGGFSVVGVIVMALIFAVVAFVIRAIARRGAIGVSPGGGSTGVGGPVRTRIVDDGFWIESGTLTAGAVIECRYVVNGQQSRSNVTSQGGSAGQFVFTGGRPSSVGVSILPGGGPSGSGRISGSPLGRAGGLVGEMLDAPPDLPSHRPGRGYPPAY